MPRRYSLGTCGLSILTLSCTNWRIRAAYDAAKEQGIYKEVIAHTGDKVEHYGLSNPMEYFAESTEAYFGVNDFFPFVRAELKQHDPRMFVLLQEIWGEMK
jgi:Mlc titration factor MtfA (ptsG expression regulator)